MTDQQAQAIAFGVKEIKVLEFLVDESKEIGENYDFNLRVDVRSDIPSNMVRLIITANYFVTKTQDHFMKGTVLTGFEIQDLKAFSRIMPNGKEAIDFPDNFWITLFSLSVTHARALIARSAAGTNYSNLIMPIINPEQEFKKIFGKEMEQDQKAAG